MWKHDEEPQVINVRRGERPFASKARIEMPPPFVDEEKQSFPCWARRCEGAMKALAGGLGGYMIHCVNINTLKVFDRAFEPTFRPPSKYTVAASSCSLAAIIMPQPGVS